MDRNVFWLTDGQFAKIEPQLPTDTRGKPRMDDRRVISGIIHVLKSSSRWVDAPAAYGRRKTLYNRFIRRADKGVWVGLFETVKRCPRSHARHPARDQSPLEKLFLAPALRNRNAIERLFCRLKDFRRVATRYDRSATNFLAAVCIAATVTYWL